MKKIDLEFNGINICTPLFDNSELLLGKAMHLGTAAFLKGEVTSISEDGVTIHEQHHKVVIMLEGKIEIVSDDEVVTVSAGESICIYAGEPHSGFAKECSKLVFILYGNEMVPF